MTNNHSEFKEVKLTPSECGALTPKEIAIEKLCQIISDKVLGWDFKELYIDKQEYINDRGSKHDVNHPYQWEVEEAAQAIIDALDLEFVSDGTEAELNDLVYARTETVNKMYQETFDYYGRVHPHKEFEVEQIIQRNGKQSRNI